MLILTLIGFVAMYIFPVILYAIHGGADFLGIPTAFRPVNALPVTALASVGFGFLVRSGWRNLRRKAS